MGNKYVYVGKFKVMDRVKHHIYGKGTVVNVNSCYGVSFDTARDIFHALDGSCMDGHGYWCDEDELTIVEVAETKPETNPKEKKVKTKTIKLEADAIELLQERFKREMSDINYKMYENKREVKSIADRQKALKQAHRKLQQLIDSIK